MSARWTSLLLEHHEVHPTPEPFETLPTPDQTIVVMIRGEQELESLRRGIWRGATYRAGTIGMTPAGTVDRLRRRVGARAPSFEKINLYIPSDFFLAAADHYRRAGQRCSVVTLNSLAFDDPAIAATCHALLRGASQGAPDLYAQSTMQWLATHLLSAHGSSLHADDAQRAAGLLTDRRLARVLEYMDAHVAAPLTLDELAREAGVSKFHFTRLFRASTGSTPHAVVVEMRLKKARRLLLTTDLTVKELAARCGFARATHFATAFRKRFGRPPTLFRATARE